jgi:hypothetical protein
MSANDASRIVIDESRVTLQIVASLTDDSRGVIYYFEMFTLLATRSSTMELIYTNLVHNTECL